MLIIGLDRQIVAIDDLIPVKVPEVGLDRDFARRPRMVLTIKILEDLIQVQDPPMPEIRDGCWDLDMTKLITARRSADALKMLNGFYTDNVSPLRIMPALVWYWGKEGKHLGRERFERGLKALEEADLNIKRSRLDPQYAVEKLVVELGLLLRR